MNFKKFISGVSALTIAASAFAGVTAIAATETTTSYNFSTASDAPTFDKSRNTNTLVAADDTTTTTLSGDKGVLQIIPSGNPGNGYAGSRFDFSGLITDATSFTVSYKTYWSTASRGIVGIGAAADRDKNTIGKTNATNSGLIGTVGRFTSESFLRATSGGNRAFLSSFTDATNRWISTVITVDVTNMKYTYTLEGDSKVTVANNAAITSVPDMLEIVTWTPVDATSIELDDLSIVVTKPDAEAATAIAVNYTNSGSTVYTNTINISDAEKMSGDTSDIFYLPAYVTDASGNVYATGLTDFHKAVTLAAGTTTVDVPVTAVAGLKNYFFEAENNGGGADEATNAYAYSNGKGKRRLDNKAVTITVPEDGIYTVKTALICKSSDASKSATITATAGSTTWDITDTYYNAYRNAAHTETGVALKAGTVISYSTLDWNMGLDYVLLTKTAEYPYAITKAATENGSFDVSAATATAGTNVTITPTAASGYEVDTVTVATADVTDNGDGTYSFTMPASDVTVSVAFKAVTPAGPSAVVTEVSYNQYEAANTAANDQDLTAAKILVTVTGSIDTLGLKYNGGSAKYVQNFKGLTDANIVLGAIVPGLATLTTSSFDAVIE